LSLIIIVIETQREIQFEVNQEMRKMQFVQQLKCLSQNCCILSLPSFDLFLIQKQCFFVCCEQEQEIKEINQSNKQTIKQTKLRND
jgi:hypothetical protein